MNFDLLTVFLAGILTFITPCVLPLMPIYLSALIGSDIKTLSSLKRGQLVIKTLFFILGFIAVFSILGLTASAAGAFLAKYKSIVQLIGALLILLFGLKFLGVIQIGFLDRVMTLDNRKLQTRFGWVNALVMGVVFAAGWSPCAGPVLGSVLTYTASKSSDPWTGAFMLSIYGLGFSIPLVFLALFAETTSRLLQRVKAHLTLIEKLIGIFLIVVAGSLAIDLVKGQIYDSKPSEANQLGDYQPDLFEPTMLMFVSKNCGVCERMKPLFERLHKECHGKEVQIKSIDLALSENQKYIGEYRLLGTPTFVFLDKRNNEVARLIGEQTEATLKQALSALRQKPCPGLSLLSLSPAGDSSQIPFPKESGKDDIQCQTNADQKSESTDPARSPNKTLESCESK